MTEEHTAGTRRPIPFFWWQHERSTQLRSADELAPRRSGTAVPEREKQSEQLPAAG